MSFETLNNLSSALARQLEEFLAGKFWLINHPRPLIGHGKPSAVFFYVYTAAWSNQQDYHSGAHASYRRVHLRRLAKADRVVYVPYTVYSKTCSMDLLWPTVYVAADDHALLSFLIVWKTVLANRKSSLETTAFSGGTSIL